VEEGLGACSTVQTIAQFVIELVVLFIHVENTIQKLAIRKKFHPGKPFKQDCKATQSTIWNLSSDHPELLHIV
jgi:hypothetical protein